MIDRNGITIPSLNDRINAIEGIYRGIYGADINLEQNTPDGQKIAIIAKIEADLSELAVQTYNSFNPSRNVGVQQAVTAKFSGLTRLQATKSNVLITITGSVVLPDNYTLLDTGGQKWILEQGVAINNTADLLFLSNDFGKITTGTNTITIQENEINGITATNHSLPNIGRDLETDEEFRIRRNKSVALPSLKTSGSLIAQIENLSGVVSASVIENNTIEVVNNQPPFSYRVLVLGGSDDDIANVIYNNHTAGSIQVGETAVTLIDENHIRVIRFARPTAINANIAISIENDLADEEITAIKNALTAIKTGINKELVINMLYGIVYNAISRDFTINSISINGETDIITTQDDEYFLIQNSNIEINYGQ